MKLQKTFLVLTTLFIFLGTNLALAVSEVPTPSGEISGEVSGETTGNTSGETPSGEVTQPSGEVTLPSGDESDDELENILASIANDSNFTIKENNALDAAMEATTNSGETFNFVVVTNPTHGVVTHEDPTNPSFTYKPDEDYVGEDSFTFRLESGEYYSNVGTIRITITADESTTIPFYYVDMQEHWANYSAAHLAARGYIIGEEIGAKYYYCPSRAMTRGDFILFLLSIVDSENTAEIAEVTFADEESTPTWMLEKAKKAYGLKIISGVGGGEKPSLDANRNITRAEAFVMINNVLKAKSNITDSTTTLEFNDVTKIPDWATQAIKNLVGYKLIQGDTDKNINPTSIVDRGQGAELAYKLLKQLEESAMTPSGDLK